MLLESNIRLPYDVVLIGARLESEHGMYALFTIAPPRPRPPTLERPRPRGARAPRLRGKRSTLGCDDHFFLATADYKSPRRVDFADVAGVTPAPPSNAAAVSLSACLTRFATHLPLAEELPGRQPVRPGRATQRHSVVTAMRCTGHRRIRRARNHQQRPRRQTDDGHHGCNLTAAIATIPASTRG
jgi:hypothetical protein